MSCRCYVVGVTAYRSRWVGRYRVSRTRIACTACNRGRIVWGVDRV